MKYTHLLPFMDNEELKEVALQVLNGELQGVKLNRFFPFLNKEDLNEIVDKIIETKNTKLLNHAIPFMSKQKIGEIYEKAERGDIPDFNAEKCIPFLGSEKIKEIFKSLIKKASEEPDEDEEKEE